MTTDPRAYVRLASLLRAEISDGIIPPRCSAAVDRRTAPKARAFTADGREALHILEREKLIHRVAGLGYYTTSPDE
jgi:hypothetical protein